MSLTAAFLNSKSGKPNEKSFTDFSDGEGLVARWSKAGSVSWYLRYRWQGKPVAFRLGSYPEMSIKEARAERGRCKALLTEMIDPRMERKSRRQTNLDEAELTVSKALDHWFEKELYRRRQDPDGVKRPILTYILPEIGDIPVASLSPQHWLDAFKTMAHAPVLAGNVLTSCKQAFRYCETSGFCTTNSLANITVKHVGRTASKRDRVLVRKEVRDIWDYCSSIETGGNIRYKLAVVILMVTGARSGELRRAHKSDFDLVNNLWTVPKERSKTGVEIRRPIPKRLVPFIQSLITLSRHKYLVIPGMKGELTKRAFTMGVGEICDALYHKRWTAHAFRHTLSTTFADLEIDPFVAEKLLGHTMGGVMSIYNKGLYLKQQADALETWIDYISTDKDFNLYM